MRFTFPITKLEKQANGTLLVEGVATSEALDSQGEVLEYEGSVKALGEWFETGANVREQHDMHKAVGKGIDIQFNDEARQIVVKSFISSGAPDTQAKLLEGVLTCYSVGGDPIRIEAGKTKDGTPCRRVKSWKAGELSVVDRGANPETQIQLVKGVTMTKEVSGGGAEEKPPAVEKEGEEMAMCSKCEKAFPAKDKVDGSAMCPKCRGGEKAAEPEAEKVAAPAPEEKPPESTEKATEPPVKKDAEGDVISAIYCLDSLRALKAAELAEGKEPKGAEQIAFLDAAIENLARFCGSEASEIADEAGAPMEMAAKPGEVQKAAGMAPVLVPLAEKVDALAKTVASIMEKLNAPAPESVAPAPDGGMIEKSLSPVLSQVSELSKAIGDLKALPGEVRALAEKVEQMGKRPAVGGPLARFAPGAVVKAAAGSPTERVTVLEDLISGAPEASRPHLLVELNRAKAAARQSEGV